jgi:hypothetical protein
MDDFLYGEPQPVTDGKPHASDDEPQADDEEPAEAP